MHLEEAGEKIYNIKDKGEKVVITLTTKKIKIYKSTFKKFNLDIGDEVDDETLSHIMVYDKKIDVYEYAKKLIVSKPYTEKELIKKINKKYDNPECLRQVLSELKKTKLVDDKDFLKNYLSYFDKNNYGKYFILNFFRLHGAKTNLINNLEFSDEREFEKCVAYFEEIKNKFVSSSYIKQKSKLYDLLLERGFPVEVILKTLDSLKIDDEKELKQLLKLYRKLKAKTINKGQEGNIKENEIVNKLVDKGYSLSMIYKVIQMDKESEEND